ncbi:MAG: hypothetical protein HC859_10455 [Bacteroidia bacterium]|nr:hypothetical protein [Bacteroidia bacterium]
MPNRTKKGELEKLDYNNPAYDDLEEQLHDLEDSFHVKFGEYLEDALQDVHDQYCPENDVLMPIAYLGKGIFVEADAFPGQETRLVLAPEPTRIILSVGTDRNDVVWTAK